MQLHFQKTLETEIYVSESGFICFKQDCCPDENQIVSLSREQATRLFKALPDLLKLQAEVLSDENDKGGE